MSKENPSSAWTDSYRSALKPLIRVVIVEDDRMTRELLSGIIQNAPSLNLLKAYPDAETILDEIVDLQAHVIVMDIQLPKRSGIECTRMLKQKWPQLQILMFTVFSDSDNVMEALKAGASGYLLKRSSAKEIVSGIEEIWEGNSPMSAGIARKIVESLHSPGQTISDEKQTLWGLSSREFEILGLLAKGYLAKEIGNRLSVGESTIRFHMRNVYQKLHVRSRSEAIVKFLS